MSAPFDTLKLADKLQAGGFTSEQARTAASALAEAFTRADLATKTDLKTEIRGFEQHLTIMLSGMVVISVGVLLAAIRYLPAH